MGHRKKRHKRSKAKKADKYALYLDSVQAPDVDVKFFSRVYRANFKSKPKVLREDFCGTAAVCCEWVKVRRDREAYGVDLDPVPLKWGEKHNLTKLSDSKRARVHLIEGDVLTAEAPKADVVAAQNFSYYLFKTRAELKAYFEVAHRSLGEKGVLILDAFGGHEAMEDDREDVTEYDGFDYVWEQASYDPITGHATFHIHFRFDDGSKLKRAFTYEWRFWTLPEIQELVLEAGFDRADVYWEDSDDDGEGNGVFRRREHGECDPAWNAYVIGVKG
jgi:SAM-dependent methyltransferase